MTRRLAALAAVVLLAVAGGALVAWASVVEVATGSFYFEDATVGDGKITIKAGDQLRFVIEDGGKGTPHTVEIPAFGISSGPLATSSTYVTVAITQPGEYQLFCKPHQKKGHETTLVVTGQAPTTTTKPTTTTTTPTTTTTTTGTTATTTTGTTATTTTAATSTTLLSEDSGSSTTMNASPVSDVPSTTITADSTSQDQNGDGGDSSTGVEATAETIPVGVNQPEQPVWTRVFPIAGMALIPLAAIALIAGRRSPTNDNHDP